MPQVSSNQIDPEILSQFGAPMESSNPSSSIKSGSIKPLTELAPGTKLIVAGDRFVEVSPALAKVFKAGDALYAVAATGEVLHVPAATRRTVDDAVARARAAFRRMGAISDAQISEFFVQFSDRLSDDATWRRILEVNERDVAAAKLRGRSTTRLVATDTLRSGVVQGLRGWVSQSSQRGRVIERVQHEGWHADLVGAELGVVGFVFEGRPNVVADATGVLRGGNTVVFRIGRDALGTAKAMLEFALTPALSAAGLPEGAVSLIDSPEHAAGWALFSNQNVSLAVARGSGPAVATLGALAQQAGIPVSLHGTGGAWMCTSATTDVQDFEESVVKSLDRKVCNTLNVCCILQERAQQLLPAFLRGLERAGARRGQGYKLHVAQSSQQYVPSELFTQKLNVRRAEGDVLEPRAELLADGALGTEWEWEDTPEVSVVVVPSLEHAIELFNEHSPQFVATLVSADESEHQRFFQAVNAPFVGDGFTRWVDGQFALRRPELGLANWEHGRLFGRGGVLSGDSVFTVRTRVTRER
jgi:glutamate-5-semialdehyde dehydrogenase